MADAEALFRNMEVIFQKDVFRILGVLAKRRAESTSFTCLKTELNLNPNLLSKHLKQLMELGFVENYYKKEENGKHYSFYRITEKALNILHLQVGAPKIWVLLRGFKEYCISKGWKASETEDWIKVKNEYHNFLWARTVKPLALREIAEKHKMAIRQHLSYKIVDVAYLAWLFSQSVPNELYQLVKEEPKFAETIAIYDLSQIYLTRPTVIRLNKTKSQVFREFENYLLTYPYLELREFGMPIIQPKCVSNSRNLFHTPKA